MIITTADPNSSWHLAASEMFSRRMRFNIAARRSVSARRW